MNNETIDMTPSWEGTVPILRHLFLYGNEQAKKSAMEAILKMAKLADAYVALTRAADAQIDELAGVEGDQ